MRQLAEDRASRDGRGRPSESPSSAGGLQPGGGAGVVLLGFDAGFVRSFYRVARSSALLSVAHISVSGLDLGQELQAGQPAAALICWESISAPQLQALARAHPQIAFVVLARTVTREQARALARCGAVAVFERSVPSRVLVAAIVVAGNGMRVEHSGNNSSDLEASELSPREIEVLGLLQCGEPPTIIALLLGVSGDTVKSQTRSIYRKLSVNSRAELLARGGEGDGGSPSSGDSATDGRVVRLDCSRPRRAKAEVGWALGRWSPAATPRGG